MADKKAPLRVGRLSYAFDLHLGSSLRFIDPAVRDHIANLVFIGPDKKPIALLCNRNINASELLAVASRCEKLMLGPPI